MTPLSLCRAAFGGGREEGRGKLWFISADFSSSLYCKRRKENIISAKKQQRNHNCWLWQTLLTFDFLFWRLVRRVVVCFTPLSPLVSIPSLPRVARLSISFAPNPNPTPKGGEEGEHKLSRGSTLPFLLPPPTVRPTPSPPNERKGNGGGGATTSTECG